MGDSALAKDWGGGVSLGGKSLWERQHVRLLKLCLGSGDGGEGCEIKKFGDAWRECEAEGKRA